MASCPFTPAETTEKGERFFCFLQPQCLGMDLAAIRGGCERTGPPGLPPPAITGSEAGVFSRGRCTGQCHSRSLDLPKFTLVNTNSRPNPALPCRSCILRHLPLYSFPSYSSSPSLLTAHAFGDRQHLALSYLPPPLSHERPQGPRPRAHSITVVSLRDAKVSLLLILKHIHCQGSRSLG